jgi:trimethylamine--corrinoid protein Co-methyltransferase
MAIKGIKRTYRALELLSEEEVQDIHSASLDILRETGVRFESKWALEFLRKNGCMVDEIDRMVRFPEGLVEECVRKTPSSFRVKTRNENYDMVYTKDTVYFQDMPAMHTIDLNTFETRPPSKQDYIDYIKVLDYLPTVHGLSAYPYFGCEGIPPVMMMPELMALKFKYTSKFHECPYANDSEIFCLEMAQTASVEILGAVSLSAPLTWFDSAVNQARRFIEAGFPVGPCSGSVFGATAPATLAGAVAKTNAELLSMIVLIQLIKPGQRALMWDADFPQDMKTGHPAFGQIGASIANAMYNQMWRFYGVPTANATVGCINAKFPDFQSGYEKSIGALVSALSGCSLVQLHGGVMGELSGHPVQAVLDNDIAGMIGRFIEGEAVNNETLAVDLIRQVGPIPGHFLGTTHTRTWWKKEQFIPAASDRTPDYQVWSDNGGKSAVEIAKEKTVNILATHRTEVLDEKACEEIDKILEKARKFYMQRGMM